MWSNDLFVDGMCLMVSWVSGMCLCLECHLVQMLCWLCCLHLGSGLLGGLNLWGFGHHFCDGEICFPDVYA